MQRTILTLLILLSCVLLRPAAPAMAGWFFDDTLVSIDGKDYSADDFKRWWKFWNDDNRPLPQTPDPYIDWLLLSREGERMELDDTPDFKRQTRIFLQARGLLMLKYEAVDSQIKVTYADVKARYEALFQPRWLVQRLFFKDEPTAVAAWQKMADGKMTVQELLELEAAQGGPDSTNENWVRANRVDPGWKAIFEKMKVGDVVDPAELGKGPILYHLKAKKGGDEEDFAKQREEIEQEVWKVQENWLTRKLLAELNKKYQVKIDKERLEALDLNAAPDTFTDAPVITTSKQNVSEKEFMAVIRRLVADRPMAAHAAADKEASQPLKRETANNIIAQSVTNWESIDRHFEEKEPFKWEYQFNYKHRLVLALEQRFFASEVKVTDDEIKQEYEKNISRYTQPTVVKLYIVDETQAPIDRMWADIAVGKNFVHVLKEQYGQEPTPQEAPANHLDPEVRAAVDKLADGETSPIFKAQDTRVMVHLVERTPEAPIPFERVKESIRSLLRKDKIERLRSTYLETLKSRSVINVRQREWKAIQEELGGA